MQITCYNQIFEKEVVELWNKELMIDTLTVTKFRKQVLLDDNFEPQLCYVALENGNVVGFLLASKRKFPYLERGLEPDRGWINVLFVAREYQRSGIGTQLLKRAESDLKRLNVTNITLAAYSPSYFFPGVDIENYVAAADFF